MQQVSNKWLPTLATDHGVFVKVSVLYDGELIANDVQFTDGAVTVDRGSDTRRSLSLTIADPSQWPAAPTDTYGVYGQRIYVEAGVTYLDGSAERVPLGTFVTTNVSGDIHRGPLTVTAAGLERLLRQTTWETATSTAGYSSSAQFLNYHVGDTIPGAYLVDLSTHGADAIATRTWDAQTDKWAALAEVATAVGAELFCGASGSFVLADVPDPNDFSQAPVWDVTTGQAGVMVSAGMALTSDGVVNRVVAIGENVADNAPPVSAEAKISNPNDPLHYGGPFGKVTKIYSSSLLTNSAKADVAAKAMLSRYRAPNRSVSLETIPNPALDAGDRIRVHYGDAHLPEIHVVQSFTVPLTAKGGASTIDTVSGRDDSS